MLFLKIHVIIFFAFIDKYTYTRLFILSKSRNCDVLF